ncbi:hypothetical protein [Chitinolyticbacter meiyuanensis]|uniref:hypothetical protein n=1 Tax=Chitinolyticbacter meiyuanensis TaxID=682798 RepID=UPI0011E58EED|nr:hypothetical protein [Chitinolyticbacter meiyuanensis]
MEAQLIDDIVAILPHGRTRFDYYPERYAWLLLRHAVGNGCNIAELRQSPYAGLLHKPRVKAWLAQLGGPRLRPDDVLAADGDATPLHFTLTLDRWQGQQTTRGNANLVLQLNFDREHDRHYQNLIAPTQRYGPFVCASHPVCEGGRNTLAWARLDIDLETGEVLIEEIQNDWLRRVTHCLKYPRYLQRRGANPDGLAEYAAWLLPRYQRIWAEAMLAATVWFVREELGIARMFYHSPESNLRLKDLDADWAPPRSLYTDLPRQFCFRQQGTVPHFLRHKRAKLARRAPLFELDLGRKAA